MSKEKTSITRSALRRSVVLAVGFIAAMAMGSATAQAGSHWIDIPNTRVGCLVKESPYGTQIAARVTTRMGIRAKKGNAFKRFEFKARLIPTSAGLNFHRSWAKNESATVRNPDKAWFYKPQVITPYNSATRDWNLQIKAIWHRSLFRKWTFEKVYGFNESFCQTGEPF